MEIENWQTCSATKLWAFKKSGVFVKVLLELDTSEILLTSLKSVDRNEIKLHSDLFLKIPIDHNQNYDWQLLICLFHMVQLKNKILHGIFPGPQQFLNISISKIVFD